MAESGHDLQAVFEEAGAFAGDAFGEDGFDLAGGGDGEREVAALVGGGRAGNIDDAEDFARDRMVHGGGGAGPGLDAFGEMFGGVDLGGLAGGERGADAVGAHFGFRPLAAGDQVDFFGVVEGAVVAGGFQDDAEGVGEEHHAAGVGQHGLDAAENVGGGGDEVPVAVAQSEITLTNGSEWGGAAGGVDAEGEAALPGGDDHACERDGRFGFAG